MIRPASVPPSSQRPPQGFEIGEQQIEAIPADEVVDCCVPVVRPKLIRCQSHYLKAAHFTKELRGMGLCM